MSPTPSVALSTFVLTSTKASSMSRGESCNRDRKYRWCAEHGGPGAAVVFQESKKKVRDAKQWRINHDGVTQWFG